MIVASRTSNTCGYSSDCRDLAPECALLHEKKRTQRFVQLAIRNSWLSSLLASLAQVMGHESFHLATTLQRFAADGLGSCAFLAEECGFARVDNVQETGTVTPGRCRRCARSGLVIVQDRICSHSPSKGALWVRRQHSTRFLRSCSRFRIWSPAAGIGDTPLHWRTISREAEHGLLQLLELVKEADGIEYLGYHGKFLPL